MIFPPSPRWRSVAVIHETGSTGCSREQESSAPRIAKSGKLFRQRPIILRAFGSGTPWLVSRRTPCSKIALATEKAAGAALGAVAGLSPRSSDGCATRCLFSALGLGSG